MTGKRRGSAPIQSYTNDNFSLTFLIHLLKAMTLKYFFSRKELFVTSLAKGHEVTPAGKCSNTLPS